MPAIELKNVGELFRMYPFGRVGLKEHILRPLQTREREANNIWALRGVDLSIRKGEAIGVIGENGSGKTTLLRLIAGILAPDEGRVRVQGRVSALLDLGAAFHHDLTGRENLYLYGSILGLNKNQIDEKFEEIVAYAELERFIDFPLKTYSSGMSLRLGFALAINVNPDILLVDEVFVVGDQFFQQRCLAEMRRFKRQGKTIVLVSHDLGLISSLCERAILLKDGAIIKTGLAGEVIDFYAKTTGEKKGIGILSGDQMNLIFNNGHCNLFWSGKEITKGMAMFSSFYSSSRWHTSDADANWNVVETSNTKIVIQGTWRNLPIRQLWILEFTTDNSICWSVENEIFETVDLERENVGIMLTDLYDTWIAGELRGEFPSQFNQRLGGWEVMWAANADSDPVHVASLRDQSKGPPALSLSCIKAEGTVISIENSDGLFEGRVVQYSKVNHGAKMKNRSGDPDVVSVKIAIGNDEDHL